MNHSIRSSAISPKLRRWAAPGALAAAAVLTLTACGGSGSSPAAATQRDPAAVSAQTATGIGKVLVNSSGRTLYSPDQEKSGIISCTGKCAEIWIPLTVPGTAVPAVAGVSGTLATVSRPDGAHQVTYDGAPLYTFALDTAPDETKGNGATDSFGGNSFTWHVLMTSGGSAAPSPSSSGGGYGNY